MRRRNFFWGLLTVFLMPWPLMAQSLSENSVSGSYFSSSAPVCSFALPIFQVTASDSVLLCKSNPKSPTVAGLCSIIPGGGQVYNGKFWKVPVVYAVLGATGGMTYHYHQKYIYYRDEYRLRLNGVTEGLNPDMASMSDENVHAYESYYRRNQELGLFVFILCYGLNIVDAVVDAHFSTFDISDDLTLQLQPGLWRGETGLGTADNTLGLSFVFHFK